MDKLMKKIKLIVVISCLFMLSSSFVFSFQSKKIVISNNLYLAKGYANYVDDAKYNFNNYGILPSLVLAVGQKEQSWKAPSWNNVFGITYSSGTCGWDDNSNAPTNPSLFPDWSAYKSSGKYKYTNGYTYRAYNSVSDSVKDFGAWLTNCYSLRDKIKAADTIEEQLLGMINYNAKGNLDYVCGLAKIINSQDFTQYDVGLTNGEHKQINLSDLGCDKETEEETENENYFTSYEGSSTDGWLYNRLKYTEEWKQFDVAIEEADIDDSINEIFRRAKLSYEAYTEEYGDPNGGTGPSSGYSAKDCEDLSSKTNYGDFNTWRQGYDLWSKIKIGNSTLGSVGCLVTSISIQLKALGIDAGITNFNPGTFACYLSKNGKFTADGSLYANWSDLVPGVSVVRGAVEGTKEDQASKIQSLIDIGCKLVIYAPHGGSSHFVAVSGTTRDNIKIIDPGAGKTLLWGNIYDYNKMTSYRCLKAS